MIKHGKVIDYCVCGYEHCNKNDPWLSSLENGEIEFKQFDIMTSDGVVTVKICPSCGTIKLK